MRRKTRNALVRVMLFLSALFAILFITSPSSASTNKNYFPWTKIVYKTTSPTLPPTTGICRGLSETSKPVLIVSRISSDSHKWLSQSALASKFHLCIYTADAQHRDTESLSSFSARKSEEELRVPANRAHESMPYLTFIIDNYDHLSDQGMVFVHGSRFSWHNDHPFYDNLPLLTSLNIRSALEPFGYHNLRCDWSYSTCPSDYAAQGSLATTLQALLVPYDKKAVSDVLLPKALKTLFGDEKGLGRGDKIRSQCCAQFVVSRDAVRQRTREEYVALRQWLLDGSQIDGQNQVQGQGAHPDDKIAGRVLSYLWHILFMQQHGDEEGLVELHALNEQACPSAEQCYCKLYGKCGLKDCKEGSCPGQYKAPSSLSLPDNWESTHS